MDRVAPLRILLVKTSSLGDIIQTFAILPYLRHHLPNAIVDWAVEERFASLVRSHPWVNQTISLPLKGLKKNGRRCWQAFHTLREQSYDWVIDLQGNCKSALVTLLARGKQKGGFGPQSVREWPNLLVTHKRYEVDLAKPITEQYRHLVQQALQLPDAYLPSPIRLLLNQEDKEHLKQLVPQTTRPKILVCPGSRWKNKQLSLEQWICFLQKIEERFQPLFLFVWGSEEEKAFCEGLQNRFANPSLLLEKMTFATWQNLMAELDLVLAVDSSALHLCATTETPSFSLFGPSSSSVYKPLGARHYAVQGACPYQMQFAKTCPSLRTCSTGSCLKDLKADLLFEEFCRWWTQL